MSLRQRITDLARTKLRTRIPPDDKNWSEINSIARTEGQDAITEAFSTFCDEHQGESIAYPLSQFIRVVDGFLDGSTVRKTDGKSEVLILDLVEMADGTAIIFDKKQSLAISKLLESYTAEDIKSAFREYFTPLDDFQLKQAAQKFTEGATQLLEMQKRRKKRAQEQEQLLTSIATQERAAADAELQTIREAQTQTFVED